MGLGPTTVVRLERALAHSWAPGLVAIVHAHPEVALMLGTARCQGRWRVVVGCAEGPGDAAGQDGEHKAGTAQQPSTTRPGHGTGGARPGQTGPGPAAATADLSSSQVTARAPARHARAGAGAASTRQKNVAAGCGQPLAGGAPASLVSRGSPDVSPAGRHRRTHRHRPGARCRGPGSGRTEQDGPGQPVYTGCGRPCGRRPGSAPATRLGRLAPRLGTMLGTQSPPPGSGPVTTDTVRTARTLGGTTA